MQTKQISVFVIDEKGRQCLPTKSSRARRLLNSGKAIVKQVVPFTIQLKREINNPIGSFTVGIDDGAKYVGVAIVNDKTNEVVFKGQINLRQDVSKKVEQRSKYRRMRRYRNLRYRRLRFDNRISSKIAPSIRCRKDSILRFIKDMIKRVNIRRIVVEEIKFNHFKFNWGKNFSLVEIGKNYLRKQIINLGLKYECVYGYMTKQWRSGLRLSKRHANDAIALVCREGNLIINSLEWYIKPKRTKVWENNPTKTCVEKKGFRHYDLVKSIRKGCRYVGSIRSLKDQVMTIRIKKDNNFVVVYNKTKLLFRPKGLIYTY